MKTNIGRKATLLALATASIIALAGCSGGADAPDQTPGDHGNPVSETPVDPAQIVPQDGKRWITITEVIDADTFKATPQKDEKDDPLYGETFTVQLDDVVAPTKGACGYDQSIKITQDFIAAHDRYKTAVLNYDTDLGEKAIDGGIHHGSIVGDHTMSTLSEQLLYKGAVRLDPTLSASEKAKLGPLNEAEKQAKEEKAGIFGTCAE